MLNNSNLLSMVKEITIAKLSVSPDVPPTKEGGESVADFMQVIYNKLKELNKGLDQ